jgi:hypothetical protein
MWYGRKILASKVGKPNRAVEPETIRFIIVNYNSLLASPCHKKNVVNVG